MGGQLSARPYSTAPTKIPTRRAVARINAAVIFNRDVARHVATNASPPSPHLRPTILLPGPLHPRISCQNPRVQRPREGVGTAQVRRNTGEWAGAYRITWFTHMVGACVSSDVACRVAINNHRFAINNHRVD